MKVNARKTVLNATFRTVYVPDVYRDFGTLHVQRLVVISVTNVKLTPGTVHVVLMDCGALNATQLVFQTTASRVTLRQVHVMTVKRTFGAKNASLRAIISTVKTIYA